ncbi:MAG: hypothetical protein P0111_10465 [Nitrospira sp.]|nr:hypothetical protein [Nitrospira sp.]
MLLTLVAQAEAAPKRPSSTAQACTLSGEQLGELQAKNPGAMNACGDLANRAAAQGRPFSFMCDAGGKVSCCDDQQCITVVAMKRLVLPPIGTSPPVLQRRGVEGERPDGGMANPSDTSPERK